MNKVFTVNLGGYPFTIDEDAFEYLDKYLKAIHKHFRGGDGYEEITGDIESRLAELFQESLGNRPIVTIKDVTNAISTMGSPEDFGADTLEDETMSSGKSDFVFKTGKRLFRDPEEEVVAGVCSGIAAYFGIADPLWIRIAFIVFTLFGGSGILLYAVLWAILPKAETAGDYLAMRGEPINVDNISKIIKDEFENLSEKVSEFGEEFGSKKKVAEKRKKVMEQLPLRNGFLF
ncbi:MAG: PspC domain-containing protein [Lewinellaceae bacterium]|nr:PspC domain-containing protein [Lewinellaceae bacterium]